MLLKLRVIVSLKLASARPGMPTFKLTVLAEEMPSVTDHETSDDVEVDFLNSKEPGASSELQ